MPSTGGNPTPSNPNHKNTTAKSAPKSSPPSNAAVPRNHHTSADYRTLTSTTPFSSTTTKKKKPIFLQVVLFFFFFFLLILLLLLFWTQGRLAPPLEHNENIHTRIPPKSQHPSKEPHDHEHKRQNNPLRCRLFRRPEERGERKGWAWWVRVCDDWSTPRSECRRGRFPPGSVGGRGGGRHRFDWSLEKKNRPWRLRNVVDISPSFRSLYF